MELGDEDLDAGAWGDPDLDIEAGEPGENGIAEDMDNGDGEGDEDGEGGWEMEVFLQALGCSVDCSQSLLFAQPGWGWLHPVSGTMGGPELGQGEA